MDVAWVGVGVTADVGDIGLRDVARVAVGCVEKGGVELSRKLAISLSAKRAVLTFFAVASDVNGIKVVRFCPRLPSRLIVPS